MHILFFTENFPPETNAPANRTWEHAREWVREGARVTVITTAPNFPSGKVHPGFSNRWKSRETVDGIEVIRVWSFVAANEGFAARLIDFLSFMVTGALAGLCVDKPGVIVATSPQLFTAVAGWVVAALRRLPFVFELRDLWPESIRAVGAMRNSAALNLIEKLELFLYRRAGKVIAVTNAFRANLIARGIDPAKIEVVTNGADLSRFERDGNAAAADALRDKLGLRGKFVASYIGTHGMAHGLATLLDAAERIAAAPAVPPLALVMLGEGAEKQALRASAVERGLHNVVFCDPVAREAVRDYWTLSDVTIVHLRDTQLFRTVIPSKMFEAMAMRVPIILAVEGEAREILDATECGIAVPPEDPEALAAALLALARDPRRREALAARGRTASRNFDRAVLAARMLEILRTVVRKKETR